MDEKEQYEDAINNVLKIARNALYNSIVYVVQREELDIDDVQGLIEDIRTLDDYQDIIRRMNDVI